MYKLKLWLGPNKEFFVKSKNMDDPYWKNGWMLVDSLEEASELSIYWIQEEIGLVYEIYNPERVEILQVREHSCS